MQLAQGKASVLIPGDLTQSATSGLGGAVPVVKPGPWASSRISTCASSGIGLLAARIAALPKLDALLLNELPIVASPRGPPK